MKIDHLERFQIKEKETGHLFCGCNQEWYFGARQRRSGCGPTVFSNILLYLFHEVYAKNACVYKEDALALMEEVWQYITPTLLGVYSTEIFIRGALEYGQEKGMDYEYALLGVGGEHSCKSALEETVRFVKIGLARGVPVAFLNLCSGRAKNIDRWHWMTVISLEEDRDADGIKMGILDNGERKETDLKVWYDTTAMGGGFVYFIR